MSGGVVHVVPSEDNTRLFLYLNYGHPTWSFEVYEPYLDSIIFQDFLIPGAGQIAITPDGRYVFYSSPGRTGTDPLPMQFLIFYDVQSNEIDTVFDDPSQFCETTWCAFPNSMAVSPDSRWLGILGGQMSLGVLYLYDILGMKFVLVEPWGASGHVFNNISTQNSK